LEKKYVEIGSEFTRLTFTPESWIWIHLCGVMGWSESAILASAQAGVF